MTEFVEVKTQGLSGVALDWAVLTAYHGDGPDWKLVGGVFGTLSLQDVRVGMDGIDQQEVFHPYGPSKELGLEECRGVVVSLLGDTVSVPKELLS